MAPAFNTRHGARFILLIQKKLTRQSPSNLLKTKKPGILQVISYLRNARLIFLLFIVQSGSLSGTAGSSPTHIKIYSYDIYGNEKSRVHIFV